MHVSFEVTGLTCIAIYAASHIAMCILYICDCMWHNVAIPELLYLSQIYDFLLILIILIICMHTSPNTLKHSIVGEPNKPSYSYRNYCMHLFNYILCDTLQYKLHIHSYMCVYSTQFLSHISNPCDVATIPCDHHTSFS